MNKKSFLFISLALVAGIFAGRTGQTLMHATAAGEKPSDPGQSARPRFGDARHTSSSPVPGQTATLRSGQTGNTKLDDIFKKYVRMDTEELWSELENLTRQNNRYYSSNIKTHILLDYILTRLGQESPLQTLARMKEEKSHYREFQYTVIESWKKKNPEAVMAYCRENMEGNKDDNKEESRMWKSIYVSLLSEQSPDKALDYLLTRPPMECVENMYGPLSQIVEKNPEKMTEVMEKFKSIKRQKWSDGFIASEWAKADWKATEQWIKTLPEESRHEILGQAVAALPEEEALQKIKTLDKKEKMEALSRLSSSLSWDAPEKGIELVLNNATEEEAAELIERNYYRFNTLDKEFSTYLDKMPAGKIKDTVLEKMISQQASSSYETKFFDPKMEDVFPLIDKMSSPEKKEETVKNTLDRWIYDDPQSVKSWVEKSNWPENKKKGYIERCNSITKSKNDND